MHKCMINKYTISQRGSFFNAFFKSFRYNRSLPKSWMAIFGVIVASDRAAAVGKGQQQKILTQGKTVPQEIDTFCLVDDECWWWGHCGVAPSGLFWGGLDSGCHCNTAASTSPHHIDSNIHDCAIEKVNQDDRALWLALEICFRRKSLWKTILRNCHMWCDGDVECRRD